MLQLLETNMQFRTRARPSWSRSCAASGIGTSSRRRRRRRRPAALAPYVEGVRHSLARDAEAIHHHYDVSNGFYETCWGRR